MLFSCITGKKNKTTQKENVGEMLKIPFSVSQDRKCSDIFDTN